MRVRLPQMVQDEALAGRDAAPLIDIFNVDHEDAFLDGPVSRRVAVLDFDPETGLVGMPTPLRSTTGAAKRREYLVAGQRLRGRMLPDPGLVNEPDFLRLSVFATVLKTLYLFESPDTLGRRVEWAFDGPQLLVVPRAGTWENAFYERESRSLQFFSFPNPSGGVVHTALSHDIVSHETAHAVVDGVAPDLYDATLPESLAIHEAVADITAAISAFRTKRLREVVLPRTEGSIKRPTAFSSFAQAFGTALGRPGALRDLLNDTHMPDPHEVGAVEPHLLSEVLSGALYSVVIRMHEREKLLLGSQKNRSAASTADWALERSARRFQRMVLRALDYLPPGEASFADFGRAVVAADAAAHPADEQERKWIVDEFIGRGIVDTSCALADPDERLAGEIADVEPARLVDSAFAAHEFARNHRGLIGIPKDRPFEVRARQRVDRVYFTPRETTVAECLLKVSWDCEEECAAGPVSRIRFTAGTTLVMDWETGAIRARLTSDPTAAGRHDESADRRDRRDSAVRAILEGDLARFNDDVLGPDGRPMADYVRGETAGNVMRLRGTGRLLHAIGAGS